MHSFTFRGNYEGEEPYASAGSAVRAMSLEPEMVESYDEEKSDETELREELDGDDEWTLWYCPVNNMHLKDITFHADSSRSINRAAVEYMNIMHHRYTCNPYR